MGESPGSTDLVAKNHEYAATPSVRRFIVLAQDRVGHLIGAETRIAMPEIGIAVPVGEFYEGLAFDSDPVSVTPSP